MYIYMYIYISDLTQEEVDKKLRQAFAKLDEMVATEKTYLEDLIAVVDGYWGYMRESKNADEESDMISMPIDLRDGKDEIAVSMPTTEKLYKFHKGYDFKFQCSCF